MLVKPGIEILGSFIPAAAAAAGATAVAALAIVGIGAFTPAVDDEGAVSPFANASLC